MHSLNQKPDPTSPPIMLWTINYSLKRAGAIGRVFKPNSNQLEQLIRGPRKVTRLVPPQKSPNNNTNSYTLRELYSVASGHNNY